MEERWPWRPSDRTELLDRARAARLVLAAEAATTDETGRPTPASLAAARDAGAFALTTPRRFGGLDADNRTMLRVLAELGSGCTTTSWLAQVSATAKSMFTDWMTPEIQEAFYADPDVRLCGTAMPLGHTRAVRGGLRISGRWPYASGCLDTHWAMVGLRSSDDDAVRLHPVVLLTSEFSIDRTWDGVDGLRGTGSHTLVADDVFVPSSFQMTPPTDPVTVLLAKGIRQSEVRLHTASTLLGPAQGALRAVEAVMSTEHPVFGTAYLRRADSLFARRLFTDAHRLVSTAEIRLLNVADALDAASVSGISPSAAEITRHHTQIVTAVRECRTATEELIDVHGSSAFSAGNPLARFWRDLSVGSRHGALNPYLVEEEYTKTLFLE